MRHVHLVALTAVTLLAACAWWMAGRRPATQPVAFSHALHVEQGLECQQCHDGVADSSDLSASYLPARAACMECHDQSCQPCMEVPAKREPTEAGAATLRFAHKPHLSYVQGDCTKCHANAKTASTLPVDEPKMALCLGCHNHAKEYEDAVCTGCHPALERMPLEAVAEFTHAGAWLDRHGMMSRADGAACLRCHPQATCAQCHSRIAPASPARLHPESVAETLIHRGDFLSSHPIDARADGDLCYRCHQVGYCQDCHKTWGLVGANNPAPHPPGWLVKGSSSFHGSEARLRIETCAACHSGQQPNCVRCHQVGGSGGNPHPSGFLKTHERDDQTESKVCRTCHLR